MNMSKMTDFYTKVMADKETAQRFEAILAGKQIQEADDAQLERIGILAKQLGFDITLEEAKAYFAQDKKLGENELEAVAGGKPPKVRSRYRDPSLKVDTGWQGQ
jgi:hypothetical protein